MDCEDPWAVSVCRGLGGTFHDCDRDFDERFRPNANLCCIELKGQSSPDTGEAQETRGVDLVIAKTTWKMLPMLSLRRRWIAHRGSVGACVAMVGPTTMVSSLKRTIWIWLLVLGSGLLFHGSAIAQPRVGSSAHRQAVLDALPLDRLTPQARQKILAIARKPTLFRRLPDQAIRCDRDMFLFMTRNPDVLVGLWDLMGITKVQCSRVGPFEIQASDGVGTLCKVDLVYGDSNQHIFVVEGSYEGKMVPGVVHGKGVFILRSTYAQAADGQTTVSGTLDCFVQLESLGLDLLARTLSPIIGRSADSNFMQTAQFISQVSSASERNPSAMLDVASRLPQVDPPVRQLFAESIVTVARRGQSLAARVDKSGPTNQLTTR